MPPKNDILFIYPPTGWEPDAMQIAENDAPPLGLLYVAAATRNAGITTAVIDLNHPVISYSELIDYISYTKPKIIAFSILTPGAKIAKYLSRMIKNKFKNIILVAGGIHATVLPEDLLCAGIDYVVLDEGEATFVELANSLLDNKPVDNICGIAYIDNIYGKIIHQDEPSESLYKEIKSSIIITPKRRVLNDLDTLPFPARDLVPILDYGQAGAICSSRGCPYSCSFCSSVFSSGHLYRTRSIAKTIEEMDTVYETYGINHFQFLDDNFTANIQRVTDLATSLLSKQYFWACQTTIMEVSSQLDTLTLMYEAGCREIYFGLETGSKEMMKKYKGIDLEKAINVLTHATNLGSRTNFSENNHLQTVVGFIIGHPEDTEETIEETIQLALKLRGLGIDTMLSIMQPYPGSRIHTSPEQFGIKIENKKYEEYLYPKANISNKNLSQKQIRNLYASGLLRIMKTYMK